MAQETIDRAVRTRPEDWVTHYDIGRFFYYERHDSARAIPYFRKVVELLPDSSIGYSALGGCLFYAGETAEARTMLEKAVAIGSRYDAFANLATLEFYEGRYAEAADLYEKALEMDDSDYQTWSYLGEASRFRHPPDTDRARAAYQRAATLVQPRLDADPDDQALLVEMASFKVHLGEAAEARDLVARALADEVNDPNVMYVPGCGLTRISAIEPKLCDGSSAASMPVFHCRCLRTTLDSPTSSRTPDSRTSTKSLKVSTDGTSTTRDRREHDMRSRHHASRGLHESPARKPRTGRHLATQLVVFAVALSVGLLGATLACRADDPAPGESTDTTRGTRGGH